VVEIYKLPIGLIGEQSINFVVEHFKLVFTIFGVVVLFLNGWLKTLLLFVPPGVLIGVLTALAWRLAGRNTGLFTIGSLVLLWNLRLWEPTLVTLSLVLTATTLSLLVAIPLGVLMGESRAVATVLTSVLDFLQAMPRFVYLVPAVIIFGIDTVGGVLAAMTLAVPPPVRLTALGISQIDREVIEAGEAFGCTRWQLLCKVKLPLAFPSILLGINQCLMMSLSMVVIAAMIGAGGLGADILTGIARLEAGQGFEVGLGIVVLAIFIDRLTKAFFARRVRRLQTRMVEP
jgi:ABC-type proline/glycine betaine transport system permease subunit